MVTIESHEILKVHDKIQNEITHSPIEIHAYRPRPARQLPQKTVIR